MKSEQIIAPHPTLAHRALRFAHRHLIPLAILTLLIWTAGFLELGRYSVYRVHPELSATEQANALLQKVGELIQLPSGEIPTMATINDAVSAKKEQLFLMNAVNGDVLIVYSSAQTALLYRPSTNKLIAVGPVNNSTQPQVSSSSSASVASSTNATTIKSKK